ncbi:MAG TPA: prepilin-type N-terminal cleavage/methylation domain-containing protein [Planctomycetota bacterium]|nr:prepilin-type N-terminal cleavage/methylation domain-containing protein [Planctomycetota bacterium]
MATRSRRPASRAGFTLIEMLVVIVILGILMSLAIVGVTTALKSARVSKTEALIEGLVAACEQYKGRGWADYPPTTMAEFKITMPNEINNGIESLTACLASRTKGDPLLTIRDDQFLNVDNDSTSKNITNWYFGDYQLREISDGFGYALCYMHWKDYDKPSPTTRRIRVDATSPEAAFDPSRSPATKTYLRPNRFQILSVGPDGKPGTQDDVQAR